MEKIETVAISGGLFDRTEPIGDLTSFISSLGTKLGWIVQKASETEISSESGARSGSECLNFERSLLYDLCVLVG